MKSKVLCILIAVALMSAYMHAQRGVRIGYIDTEFILENLPEYQDASSQLESKLANWKSDIDKRLAEVESKKQALEKEKILLTKELYDERFEDITFEEAEILDYQQKRFGPNGDMIIQRTQLIQPIQDQIYAAVKEIAENKKFDFIFDKNADFLMLYSAERYNISEQVLRIITRTSAREQAKTKKERKALEDEQVIPETENTSNSKDDRTKALEERKAQREAELEQKRLEREKIAEERRQKQLEAREARLKEIEARRQRTLEARKQRTSPKEDEATEASDTDTEEVTNNTTSKTEDSKTKTAKELQDERRQQILDARDARKKELEERRKKILEQRKKSKEERLKFLQQRDSIRKAKAAERNNG